MQPPLRSHTAFGTFAIKYLNKVAKEDIIESLKEVPKQWEELDSKERATYEDLALSKRKQYVTDKFVYNKCYEILNKKYNANHNKVKKNDVVVPGVAPSTVLSTSISSPTNRNEKMISTTTGIAKLNNNNGTADINLHTKGCGSKDRVTSTSSSQAATAVNEEDVVHYTDIECIPNFDDSSLNLQTWSGILSTFIKEMDNTQRGYESDEEDELQEATEAKSNVDNKKDDAATEDVRRREKKEAEVVVANLRYVSESPTKLNSVPSNNKSALGVILKRKTINQTLDPYSLVKFLLEIMLLSPVSGLFYNLDSIDDDDIEEMENKLHDFGTLYKKFALGYYSKPHNCIDVEAFEKDVNGMFESFMKLNKCNSTGDTYLASNSILTPLEEVDVTRISNPKQFQINQQILVLKEIFDNNWPEIKSLCAVNASEMNQFYKMSQNNKNDLEACDSIFIPGDIVQTVYGIGTIVRTENNMNKLIIELDDWILAHETHPILICNPREVTLLKQCLEVNMDRILPPQKWVNIKKLSINGNALSEKDKWYGKDVVLENSHGVDARYVGYVGKVLDIGIDQRWRRVQLYPLSYQKLRNKLEFYRTNNITEDGKLLNSVEKGRWKEIC